jgi:hypothetical protein
MMAENVLVNLIVTTGCEKGEEEEEAGVVLVLVLVLVLA